MTEVNLALFLLIIYFFLNKKNYHSYMSKLSTKQRKKLPQDQFAFPDKREEPIENPEHVRNAIARFDQVKGVTNEERDQAWSRIKKAAGKFHVEMNESDWRELYTKNHRPLPK